MPEKFEGRNENQLENNESQLENLEAQKILHILDNAKALLQERPDFPSSSEEEFLTACKHHIKAAKSIDVIEASADGFRVNLTLPYYIASGLDSYFDGDRVYLSESNRVCISLDKDELFEGRDFSAFEKGIVCLDPLPVTNKISLPHEFVPKDSPLYRESAKEMQASEKIEKEWLKEILDSSKPLPELDSKNQDSINKIYNLVKHNQTLLRGLYDRYMDVFERSLTLSEIAPELRGKISQLSTDGNNIISDTNFYYIGGSDLVRKYLYDNRDKTPNQLLDELSQQAVADDKARWEMHRKIEQFAFSFSFGKTKLEVLQELENRRTERMPDMLRIPIFENIKGFIEHNKFYIPFGLSERDYEEVVTEEDYVSKIAQNRTLIQDEELAREIVGDIKNAIGGIAAEVVTERDLGYHVGYCATGIEIDINSLAKPEIKPDYEKLLEDIIKIITNRLVDLKQKKL